MSVFRDLGQKAADDAVAAIMRTVDLIETEKQPDLYFSVVLSICAHMCWAAHKAGGGPFADIVDRASEALHKAEAEYQRQEREKNKGLN